MNIYCSSDGTIFHVDTERIYQGSAGSNTVRFIGQFPSNAQVLVAYKLPNGVLKGPKILTPIAELEEINSTTGGIFSVWETVIGATPKIDAYGNILTKDGKTVYDLDYSITENFGIVEMQFFVYPSGEAIIPDGVHAYNVSRCIATASTSFQVEKGVPMVISENVLEGDDVKSIFAQILSYISSLNSNSPDFSEIKSTKNPFTIYKLDKDGNTRAKIILRAKEGMKNGAAVMESESVILQAYDIEEDGTRTNKASLSVDYEGKISFVGNQFFVNGDEVDLTDGTEALEQAKDNKSAIDTLVGEQAKHGQDIESVTQIANNNKDVIEGLDNKYRALSEPTSPSVSYYYRAIKLGGETVNDIRMGASTGTGDALVERDGAGRAQIQDPVEPLDIVNKQTMERVVKPIEDKLKGLQMAVVLDNYSDVVDTFNAYNKSDGTFHLGQTVYVREKEVPDLWISDIVDTKKEYTYTNDDDFVRDLNDDNIIQIGCVIVSPLKDEAILDDYANASDLAATNAQVQSLLDRVNALEYVAMEIKLFTATVLSTSNGTAIPYKGDTVTSVYLSWDLSKNPNTLTLNGSTLNTSSRTYTDTTTFTKDSSKTWILSAKDEKATIQKTVGPVTFYNAIHYGVADASASYNSSFIKGLSKKDKSSYAGDKPDISGVTGVAGKYLFYCAPSDYECSFIDNDTGLAFAMEKAATNVTYTNGTYSAAYTIYKSINSIVGNISVMVK